MRAHFLHVLPLLFLCSQCTGVRLKQSICRVEERIIPAGIEGEYEFEMPAVESLMPGIPAIDRTRLLLEINKTTGALEVYWLETSGKESWSLAAQENLPVPSKFEVCKIGSRYFFGNAFVGSEEFSFQEIFFFESGFSIAALSLDIMGLRSQGVQMAYAPKVTVHGVTPENTALQKSFSPVLVVLNTPDNRDTILKKSGGSTATLYFRRLKTTLALGVGKKKLLGVVKEH